MTLAKKDWILLALRQRPLDRIRIMKTLFLIWHRSQRNMPDYFQFVPYLYGPCSFEVYSILEHLRSEGLIAHPPHSKPEWVNYHLTDAGRRQAQEATRKASPEVLTLIKRVAEETSRLSFYELLQQVYAEAPDFAANSVFKSVIQ